MNRVRRALRALLPALVGAAFAASGCSPKPTSIKLSSPKITIHGLKRGAVVRGDVLDKKGAPIPGAIVQWESSKPTVATVDGNGVVKSVSAGQAMLTAKFQELTASVRAEVVDVAAITITPARATLTGGKGARTAFLAEVKDSTGAAVHLHPAWSSTTPTIATIDSNGMATAVAEGRAGIIASLGEVSAPADLTVTFRDIASFEVMPPTILLKASDSQKLNIVAKDAAGRVIEDVAVVWTSSDPKTAVAAAGVVRGLSPGSTTIRATCGPRTVDISVVVLP